MAEELPEPKNRKEEYLANIAGMDVELPEPANREEIYLNAIAENGGGGTSDFNQLSNRPKYNGQEMTSSTDIPVPDNVKIIDETCLNWNSVGLPVEPYNEVAVFLLEPGVYEVTPDFQYNVIPDPSVTVEEHRHYRFIVPEPTEFENGDYGDYKQISVYAFCLDGNYSYGNTNGITEYVSNYNKDGEGEWYPGGTKEYTTSSYVNDFISTYVMPLFPQISSTVPDADTQGQLGGLLIVLDENASADQRTARLFICDGDKYDNVQQKFVYYWTEIGAGGGGGGDTVYSTVTTSNSTTGGAVYIGNLDANQAEQVDPTTTDNHYKYFWALPYDNSKKPTNGSINILGGSDNYSFNTIVLGNESVVKGNGAFAIGWGADSTSNSVALGRSASAGLGNSNINNSVAIGTNTRAGASYSIAIGGCTGNGYSIPSKDSEGSVAIGKDSMVGTYISPAKNAVAIGAYSYATRQGELSVGLPNDYNSEGFNSTKYRLISGVYDGQDVHDAATVAQGNTLATSAPTTSTVGVLGQLYTDTTNMHTYQCTAIDDVTDPSNPSYTWTQRW